MEINHVEEEVKEEEVEKVEVGKKIQEIKEVGNQLKNEYFYNYEYIINIKYISKIKYNILINI